MFFKNHTVIQVLYKKNERRPKIVFTPRISKPTLFILSASKQLQRIFYKVRLLLHDFRFLRNRPFITLYKQRYLLSFIFPECMNPGLSVTATQLAYHSSSSQQTSSASLRA